MEIPLHKLITLDEAKQCAELMSSSEPWVTLKRNYEHSLKKVLDRTNDTYLLKIENDIIGFVIVSVAGGFTPHIRSIAMKPEYRNRGLGTKMIRSVEQIYAQQYEHIFICVSSFNEKAKKLYLSLGYEIAGELKDYVIKGHSEWMLWKPLSASPHEPPAVSTRKDLLNVDFIYNHLKNSYWARNVTKEDVIGRIMNSLCFGIFIQGRQIGFARVVTDYFSFAYLADVFVEENERHKGYSLLLLDHIFNYPELTGIKWLLATMDAHGLYKKYEFTEIANPERFMGKNGWKPWPAPGL